MPDVPQFITEQQLEQRLGLARGTFAKRRARRQDSPPMTKVGRAVRYSLPGVEAWLAAHTTASAS